MDVLHLKGFLQACVPFVGSVLFNWLALLMLLAQSLRYLPHLRISSCIAGHFEVHKETHV